MRTNSPYTAGMSVCIWLIFGAVRMPATTSSPWALVRYSP